MPEYLQALALAAIDVAAEAPPGPDGRPTNTTKAQLDKLAASADKPAPPQTFAEVQAPRVDAEHAAGQVEAWLQMADRLAKAGMHEDAAEAREKVAYWRHLAAA